MNIRTDRQTGTELKINFLKIEDQSQPDSKFILQSFMKGSQDNTKSTIIPLHTQTEKLYFPIRNSEPNFFQQEPFPTRKSRQKEKRCFKCIFEDCNFASYSEPEVSMHTAQHQLKGETYKCTQCNLIFLKKESNYKHSQSHLMEYTKLEGCEFPGCHKRYTTIYNRDIHMRKHTGETPFKCKVCGRAYYERANYKYHVRTGHVHVPRDQKVCQHAHCLQRFKSIKTKLVHHSKFEPECEREKGILIDLLTIFKTTAESLRKRYNIEESSLKDVDEYRLLNEQYEETSKILLNKDALYAATLKKIPYA